MGFCKACDRPRKYLDMLLCICKPNFMLALIVVAIVYMIVCA